MAGKPIIFSGPMVRALLEGRKTQTRRGLKIRGRDGFFQFGPSDTPGYDWTFRREDHVWEDYRHDKLLTLLPYSVGDRLWVRETHYAWGHWEYTGELTKTGKRKKRFVRENDGKGVVRPALFEPTEDPIKGRPVNEHGLYKRPGMFMHKADSRITLTVTDVRAQRLQEISAEDIKAEGITWWQNVRTHHKQGVPRYETGWSWDYPLDGKAPVFGNMHVAFHTLWNRLNGPDAWGRNDWVAAYAFTVGHAEH